MKYPALVFILWVLWIHGLTFFGDRLYDRARSVAPPPPVSVTFAPGPTRRLVPAATTSVSLEIVADRSAAADLMLPIELRGASESAPHALLRLTETCRLPAGETHATLPLSLVKRSVPLPAAFWVHLRDAHGVTAREAQPLEIIRVPAAPPPVPVVAFAVPQVTVTEKAGRVEIPLTLRPVPPAPALIRYCVGNLPEDRVRLNDMPGRLTAQTATPQLSAAILDNARHEGDAELSVTLLEAPDLAVAPPRSLRLLLQDDEPPPRLSLHASPERPLENATEPPQLSVRVDVASSQAIHAVYRCLDTSTAVLGTDWLPPPDFDTQAKTGKLTIPAGDREASVPLALVDNRVYDGDRTLAFAVIEADVAIDQPQATLTVGDDEPQPTLILTPSRSPVREGAGLPLVLTATVDAVSRRPVEISYRLAKESTLESGVDFGPPPDGGYDGLRRQGVLTIAPGERQTAVSFPVLDDRVPEATKYLLLEITEIVGAKLPENSSDQPCYRWEVTDDDPRLLLVLLVTSEFGTPLWTKLQQELRLFLDQHGHEVMGGKIALVSAQPDGIQAQATLWDASGKPSIGEQLEYEPLDAAFGHGLQIRQQESVRAAGAQLETLILWPCHWTEAQLTKGPAGINIPKDGSVRLIWIGVPRFASPLLDEWFGTDPAGKKNWDVVEDPQRNRLHVTLQQHLEAAKGNR